jgi:hypothetical protein
VPRSSNASPLTTHTLEVGWRPEAAAGKSDSEAHAPLVNEYAV